MPVDDQEARALLLQDMTAVMDPLDDEVEGYSTGRWASAHPDRPCGDWEANRVNAVILGLREMREAMLRMGEAARVYAEAFQSDRHGFTTPMTDAMVWKAGGREEVPPWRV